MRSVVPTSSPEFGLRGVGSKYNADIGARSAEQNRLKANVLGVVFDDWVALFQRNTCFIRSCPLSTCREFLSMTYSETNAPAEPWSRVTPTVLPSSWFMSTVKVPSPLSNAPRP